MRPGPRGPCREPPSAAEREESPAGTGAEWAAAWQGQDLETGPGGRAPSGVVTPSCSA